MEQRRTGAAGPTARPRRWEGGREAAAWVPLDLDRVRAWLLEHGGCHLAGADRDLVRALALAPLPSVLLDADARVLWASPEAAALAASETGPLAGRWLADRPAPSHDGTSSRRQHSYEVRRSGGAWVRVHLAVHDTAAGVRTVMQLEDVTLRRAEADRLQEQAHVDALTGLPGRSRSMQLLREALASDAASGVPTFVFFCDLDRLKLVNDGHGHAVGDRYIQEVAGRLRRSLRQDDVVGRLSGDEFVVVLRDVTEESEALALATRVVDAVRVPWSLGELHFSPSVSVGISSSAGGCTDADALLAQADAAMYVAKVEERGSWHVYAAEASSTAADHLRLRADLPGALERDELVLHYQPIVRAVDGEVDSYEALLRWRHPTQGLLLPRDFLHVLLGSEFESAVTDWAVRRACHDSVTHLDGATVSINVSSQQVRRRDLPARVAAALRDSGLPPQRLVLELTEERLLAGPEGVACLQALRATGARVAIDDFGTGYAGLDYLQRFDCVDVLKLDGTLSAALGQEPACEHIMRSMITLARGCGLRLVVEGVEREDQLVLLRRLGADLVQGHWLGRPVPLV